MWRMGGDRHIAAQLAVWECCHGVPCHHAWYDDPQPRVYFCVVFTRTPFARLRVLDYLQDVLCCLSIVGVFFFFGLGQSRLNAGLC